MGKVKFLSELLISRIAAGEVVETPASVVKELMENSLDAGADNIFIDLKSGGKTLISVKDDGSGIESDDMEKIFRRHATSKIEDMDDLNNIMSLGFRGEALYSISAVSDVVLQSQAGGLDGRDIHIRGGEKIGDKDISRSKGTTIEVRELFFNTPARRKFLKSDTTEFRRIVNLILPYTIVFYDKRFVLTHNGRNVFDFRPSGDKKERFCEVAGIKKEYLVSATREMKEKKVVFNVLLGDINLQFPAKNRQYVFINNRPVYSRGVSYSINAVYEDIFPRGAYPAFALFMQLPPGDVDVNIHPAKREVKLKDEGYVISVLADFCKEALLSRARAKEVSQGVYPEKTEQIKSFAQSSVISEQSDTQMFFSPEYTNSETDAKDIRTKLKDAFYAGSYKNKYLFFEAGDVLLVMDQHAAHERIRYELLKRQWESGEVDIQRLLTPLIIKINYEEMVGWDDGKEVLETLGFMTTKWDADSVAFHSFPCGIKNPETAIRNILAEKKFKEFDKDTLARKACKGSITAGDRITEREATHIKNELLKCETPLVCPHGRPTVVEFSELFFDRQFSR